jgi:putative peptidoglycan lipid II flippase
MNANHYNWKIFNAALVVTAVSFFAKIFSAIKDLVVAAIFGTGIAVDAFILAALIPLMSVQVIAAPYGSALVPELTRLRVAGNEFAACRFFERYLGKAVLGLTFFSIVLYCGAFFIGELLSPAGYENALLIGRTLQILAPLTLIAGISQILVSVLNAFEHFALPAFSQILSPLGVIVALYFDSSSGATAIAWGALIGNFAQLIFLLVNYFILRTRLVTTKAATPITSINSLWASWSALFVSALLMSSTDIVDQIMAVQLGVGEVAALSYGTKVVGVLISVVAGALGSAAFPYISQMIERREQHLLAQTLRTYVKLILACSLVFVIGVCLFSESITWLLFERGAFSSSDTSKVASIQQFAIVQLPFYLINTLYMRVIMGHKLMADLLRITLVSITLNVLLNLLFSRFIGVAGIALSTSCVYVWSSVALAYKCNQQNLLKK